MKTFKILSILLITAFGLTSSGCKKKGCTESLANNFEDKAKKDDGSCKFDDTGLEITFSHSVDNEVLILDSVKYVSAAGNKYSVEKLLYFISDVIVYNENGDSIFIDTEHYVDASDNATLLFDTKTSLPVGTYTGIKFTFGLDAEKNISERYPNAPESNMEWPEPIGGGYHFMKLEGKYDSLATSTRKNYQTHTGSQTMMNMTNLNHFYIEIDKSFEVEGHSSANIIIDMNINNWYDQPVYDFNNYDGGIMMNMAVQDTIQSNGANVFSISNIDVTE